MFHQENRGVSFARNKGIDNANGNYICFIDSDDWVEKDYLEKLYRPAEKFRANLVISGIQKEDIFDGGNDVVNIVENYNKNKTNIFLGEKKEIISFFCKVRNDPCLSAYLHAPVNKLYFKDMLKNVKFDCTMRSSEDYCFNLDVLTNILNNFSVNQYSFSNGIILIPENTYHYRFVQGSATHGSKWAYKKIDCHDKFISLIKTKNFCLYNNIRQNNISHFIIKETYNLIVITVIYSIINKLQTKESDEILDGYRRLVSWRQILIKNKSISDLRLKLYLIFYLLHMYRTLKKVTKFYIRSR